MEAYRLYFIGPDGHFSGVEVIEAADDEAATGAARKHIGARRMELWQLHRHIKDFPASTPANHAALARQT